MTRIAVTAAAVGASLYDRRTGMARQNFTMPDEELLQVEFPADDIPQALLQMMQVYGEHVTQREDFRSLLLKAASVGIDQPREERRETILRLDLLEGPPLSVALTPQLRERLRELLEHD